ncbi:MAG: PadR family transcriptional regulator [Chloroflexi bacterium]|nr:PadR family transcriptional regulator [Chloroflexota bacterium]MCL5611311.1 PadR family transcriptional regulator [Chloroflexota bacterium]
MPLEHAILAFLEYQPMSGYDLKKFFDQSVAHFWSATQSHIYKSLDGLEKKGWAEAKVIPQEGKPNRKEYQITVEGRGELRRWLVTPLPLEPVREAALIQIFFSHFSSNEEIAALFETRMKEIRERLKILRNVAQAAIDENAKQVGIERARQLWQITLDYGIDYYEFELAWHEKTLKTVRNLPPLTMPQS